MRVAPACIVAVVLTVTIAKADLTRQDPIERVNLGTADCMFTRKVEVKDADGKSTIGEIKGTIREIEVYPGGTAEG